MAPKTIKIDDVEYVQVSEAMKPTGPESIVRTYAAGVHIGTVVSVNTQTVVLKNARRLWKWSGAFTLNAVATAGVDRKESRISVPVPEITLLDAIEVIPVCAGVDLSTTEGK